MLKFQQTEKNLIKYFSSLRACPLFNGVSDPDIERMLGCFGAKAVEFDKKYTIFAEGSPAKKIGILLSGKAQTVQVDYYGNRSILGEIVPGEMFGEAFACAETPALPVSVIADEPCAVMLIDSDHLLHTCKNACGFHQQIIYNLMKDLATKNIAFHKRMEITSKRSTREKLLAYLAMQAKKADNNTFDIPFDRQELADYLEVDRSGLSSEISKLKNEGIIENYKSSFKLL